MRWCFEDEATAETETLLTRLQNEEVIAWVPGIWPYEMLTGLGKGVARERLSRPKAFHLWQEIRALPIYIVEMIVDETLLALALQYNQWRQLVKRRGRGAKDNVCSCAVASICCATCSHPGMT